VAKAKAEMTTKKSGPGRPTKPAKGRTFGVRMEPDYLAWITGFAERERVPVASLFDQALAAYARERGYTEPPKRV